MPDSLPRRGRITCWDPRTATGPIKSRFPSSGVAYGAALRQRLLSTHAASIMRLRAVLCSPSASSSSGGSPSTPPPPPPHTLPDPRLARPANSTASAHLFVCGSEFRRSARRVRREHSALQHVMTSNRVSATILLRPNTTTDARHLERRGMEAGWMPQLMLEQLMLERLLHRCRRRRRSKTRRLSLSPSLRPNSPAVQFLRTRTTPLTRIPSPTTLTRVTTMIQATVPHSRSCLPNISMPWPVSG
jgi:hypothetical protein